jgi:thiol-activated cytolysin
MPNAQIDRYIAGLDYDPRVLLSVVPDGTTSAIPVKNRENTGNGVIICTKIQHTLNKNLTDVAILSPTAGVIFPGALVLVDQNLAEGHPTPIALPRGNAILSVDLPGLTEPSGAVVPINSEVQRFMNAKLEEWNKQATSEGYINAARSFIQVTQSFSSQQVSLDLGFSSKWTSGSASAQIGTSSTTEKSVIVAYFKQVFYTVAMDPPTFPSSVFDDSVTLHHLRQVTTASAPPGYVRSVDYGRILMVKMETSSVDTSVNLKGAFEQATQGGVTVGGDLKAKYENIIRNSSFTALAIGGGAETPAQFFSGSSQAALKGLQDYVNKDARYRRDNPGSPISYTVTFLRDNEFARMGFTTDYTETECVRYPNAFVKVAHAGAYVAKFKVTWVEPDSYGTYNQPKEWESGDTTVGFTHQVDMPGDAQGVKIYAWAATGLIWDPWGEIMNISLSGPDNKAYRATGTTLDRQWDNNA